MNVRIEKTVFDIEDVSDFTIDALEICLAEAGLDSERSIAEAFFDNEDHGIIHSQAVWNRCLEIINESPLLWQLAKTQSFHDSKYARRVLILASIFHDISRFWGSQFSDHEEASAKMVRNIFSHTGIEQVVYDCIIHHDYFNELANGCRMPASVMQPMAEIFRLADKTSISPSDELIRYFKTGRRLLPDMPIFDPNITDEIRFNLSDNTSERTDELSWFLFLFSLQSTDFVYGDTRDMYAYWSRGKKEALETIKDLCLQEEYLEGQTPVDPSEAVAVVTRFCQVNNLIIAA